jgi:hypothetical protein
MNGHGRTLRVLKSKVLKRSGFTFQTFVSILPAFARYFVVLMCLTYFFALLGAASVRVIEGGGGGAGAGRVSIRDRVGVVVVSLLAVR